MSRIQDTVAELHRLPGVKGAALITNDGMVVAAALDDRFEPEVIAGLASYLLMTTQRCLAEGGLGKATHYVLTATHGKAIVETFDDSSLVVMVDQFVDLGRTEAEVREAAQRIRRASRIA
ncbi:MAG: roadblock/LC7 domain-containing protein [Planctomycetes bacterium]|nr:roadblock/LC7 domain-containing protein [Planctomycetota bacterium]